MAKKEYGICAYCGKKLGKYYLQSGRIKLCSFDCQDNFFYKKECDTDAKPDDTDNKQNDTDNKQKLNPTK